MAAFTFVHEHVNHLGQGVHNFSTGAMKMMLTNTAPVQATTALFADVTEIAAGNGYTATGVALDSEAWAETGGGTGIWQFTCASEVVTASGGSIAAFQYPVIYNDTPTSPADPVIGYLNYGSSIVITVGNTFTLTIGGTGLFRIGIGTIT
jgi:hypothetical protein